MSRVAVGTDVRIKQLSGSAELTHRLREMGFCEEQRIKLVSRQTNVICQVCNARLGLSTELAESILVERLPAKANRLGWPVIVKPACECTSTKPGQTM